MSASDGFSLQCKWPATSTSSMSKFHFIIPSCANGSSHWLPSCHFLCFEYFSRSSAFTSQNFFKSFNETSKCHQTCWWSLRPMHQ
jgi:hypothetical protein